MAFSVIMHTYEIERNQSKCIRLQKNLSFYIYMPLHNHCIQTGSRLDHNNSNCYLCISEKIMK